jgi:hypothetical protein
LQRAGKHSWDELWQETALADLEVQAKAQDIRLKGALGVLDLAKKIDAIKDRTTRELIRQRFLADMAGLASTDAAEAKPRALESSHTLDMTFEPLKTRARAGRPVEKPKGKSGKSKRGAKR